MPATKLPIAFASAFSMKGLVWSARIWVSVSTISLIVLSPHMVMANWCESEADVFV